VIRTIIGLFLISVCCAAQQLTPAPSQQPSAATAAPTNITEPAGPAYVISATDQIAIRALEIEELSVSSFRVDSDGTVNLPIVGRIVAAGLTVRAFEASLATALRRYVRDPQVIVSVIQSTASPVFFVGPFRAPGMYGLQGQKRLMDMMVLAGGLQSNTIRRIRLTRRAAYGNIPLPGATVDTEKKVSVIDVPAASLQDGSNEVGNLIMQPYDVVSAERAEMIYMIGAVNRVGGIEIGERESLPVTQALAMAGGVAKGANLHIHVLRPVLDTNRRADIEVDLKQIYAGKLNDFPLMPNDHVYVRSSRGKQVALVAVPLMLATVPFLIYNAID
jgi:polysaccharide biosynthesis/export protein